MSNAATPDGLTVRDLSCQRGDRLLFADQQFHLAPGQALQIKGENGAGKTSLLQTLAGLLSWRTGTICLAQYNLKTQAAEYQSKVLYLGHKAGLHAALTVQENVHYLACLHHVADQPTDPDYKQVLTTLNLTSVANQRCDLLSSGQRRRVLLSLLLTTQKQLWLLDEPFTALDQTGQAIIESLLNQHLNQGGMLVITSHQRFTLTNHTIGELNL